ncbi:MAG TPA: MdtA/MuxA family multidrug efflux RND transporter periplasmic adaptor subunit [Blastocatellia bacterium]|nr:MdtA/MuxA family multidrug efflux RND transporter periplasmic adaptor subunit [Blastocatellia bacterium]
MATMDVDTRENVGIEEVDSEKDKRTGPRRPASKKRWWLRLLILLIIGALVYWAVGRWQARQAAELQKRQPGGQPTVPVVVASARKADVPFYLRALGSVDAFNTVTVKTRVDGQLITVAFKEGQFVKLGDLLAEVDPRPFQVQLAQAQGQLARDNAQLNNSRADLQRYQTLYSQGVVPKQQLDTQQANVGQFEGVIKADEALIDSAKLQLTYCRITSPIAGRIGLRQVDVGNIVHPGDPNGLVVITQLQPIAVLFTIPEDNLNIVLQRLKQSGNLPVEAYDRSGQNKITSGRLVTVDNQIDQQTGTSRLKAVFDNKDSALFPNQFVNIRLLVETKKDKIVIPAPAIQRGPKGTFVYVLKPDQTVEVRNVDVGMIEGNDATIENGLAEGEQVVTDGVDKLNSGSKVQVTGDSGPKA